MMDIALHEPWVAGMEGSQMLDHRPVSTRASEISVSCGSDHQEQEHEVHRASL